jgi:hypothetical protein
MFNPLTAFPLRGSQLLVQALHQTSVYRRIFRHFRQIFRMYVL